MLPLSEHSPHITVYVILLYMPTSPNLYANMYSDKEYYILYIVFAGNTRETFGKMRFFTKYRVFFDTQGFNFFLQWH